MANPIAIVFMAVVIFGSVKISATAWNRNSNDNCNDLPQANIQGSSNRNKISLNNRQVLKSGSSDSSSNNTWMETFISKLKEFDSNNRRSPDAFSEINLSPEYRGTPMKIEFVNAQLLIAMEICPEIDLKYLDILQGLTGYSLAKLELRYHKLDFLYFKETLTSTMDILSKCWRNHLLPRNSWISTDFKETAQDDLLAVHVDLLDPQYEDSVKFQIQNACKDAKEYLESFRMLPEFKHVILTLWQVFKIAYIGCSEVYGHRYEPARYYVIFQTLILNPLAHSWLMPDRLMTKTARELEKYHNLTQGQNFKIMQNCINSLYLKTPMEFVPCFEILSEDFHIY